MTERLAGVVPREPPLHADVPAPDHAQGIAIPLPFWTELATRFDTGRGVGTVERLTGALLRPAVLLQASAGRRSSSWPLVMSAGPRVTRVGLR